MARGRELTMSTKQRAITVAIIAIAITSGGVMAMQTRVEPTIDRVAKVSLLVKDQDAALRWYTEVLGFEKRADDRSRPGFRWLTVAPRTQPEFEVVLLQADAARMGDVGRQPTAVLLTSDCRGVYDRLKARGVEFPSPPADTGWGVSAVFVD